MEQGRSEYESRGFFSRMIRAHGWRYVMLIIAVYGINQGAGEGWTFFAQQYWLTDPIKGGVTNDTTTTSDVNPLDKTSISSNSSSSFLPGKLPTYGLGLSPARYSEIDAFTNIPWQIKALYGMASDVLPIRGYHKTPYMIMASLAGVLSFWLLWTSSMALSPIGSAFLLLFANFSIASPDVMIDGSVAEKSSAVPFHAADLQSLCWMSLGVFKVISLLVAPTVFETHGARALFGLTTFTALAVFLPSVLGWMGEERKWDNLKWSVRLGQFMQSKSTGPFLRLAFLITGISLTMGFVSMRGNHVFVSAFATFLITPLTAWLVYRYESQVDVDLAKFSLYVFLSGAIQPSAPVLFYWMKADEFNCAQNLPCFSPEFIANLSIVGYITFVVGTWLYNRFLTGVSYKRIYTTTQLAMFFLNMIDLIWVNRWNVKIGLSDHGFVLGDEVIAPMIGRWNTMPMLILSAVLCPPEIYATFFALNMGLSNFGATLGEYFGIGLMVFFGVETHKYDNLASFVIARSMFRLLPLVLIPLLLPSGSPREPPIRPWDASSSDNNNNKTSPASSDDQESNSVQVPSALSSRYAPADVVAASEMVSLTKNQESRMDLS